jgi:hypothetical protein
LSRQTVNLPRVFARVSPVRGIIALIGAKLVLWRGTRVGFYQLPYRRELSQQDGYFMRHHPTIVDSQALRLRHHIPRHDSVCDGQYKINFPHRRRRKIDRYRPVVCPTYADSLRPEVISVKAGEETLCQRTADGFA